MSVTYMDADQLRAATAESRLDMASKRIAELEAENERLRYELETIRRDLTALADKAARARDNAAEQ